MRRRAREGRAALVGRLYDEHGASLFRYALMLLADRAGAEDAVHQVFAAVMRRPAALENPAHYLRRAVRNECYSTLRRRVAEPALVQPLLEPAVVEAVSVDERIALERALVTLPAAQREVIHLHAPASPIPAGRENLSRAAAADCRARVVGLHRVAPALRGRR